MPSVTQVLDYCTPPQLCEWFKKNSQAKIKSISEETARIGSLVDELIQQDISDGGYLSPDGDEQALNCLNGWERLKKDKPGFVASVKEMQVELVVGELIGHPDYICIEESGWGITDLKCTSGIRDKNWIQVAKYAWMVMVSRGWLFPSFIRVIRLQRNSDSYEWLEIREMSSIRYCIDLFDSYLGVFNSEAMFKEYFRNQLEERLLNES